MIISKKQKNLFLTRQIIHRNKANSISIKGIEISMRKEITCKDLDSMGDIKTNSQSNHFKIKANNHGCLRISKTITDRIKKMVKFKNGFLNKMKSSTNSTILTTKDHNLKT